MGLLHGFDRLDWHIAKPFGRDDFASKDFESSTTDEAAARHLYNISFAWL